MYFTYINSYYLHNKKTFCHYYKAGTTIFADEETEYTEVQYLAQKLSS